MKQYESVVRRLYLAELNKLNFNDPKSSADTVNAWVDKKTHGLIPTIIDEGEQRFQYLNNESRNFKYLYYTLQHHALIQQFNNYTEYCVNFKKKFKIIQWYLTVKTRYK